MISIHLLVNNSILTYLHNPIPIISGRNSEQGEIRNAEVLERRVSGEAFARSALIALDSAEQLHPESGKYEEHEKEK